MKYRQVVRAEQKPDVYGGDSCDQHEAQWDVYAEGDRDSETSKAPLTLDPKDFPAGTRITITVPVCPRCDCDAGLCRCTYDWKAWAENQYS